MAANNVIEVRPKAIPANLTKAIAGRATIEGAKVLDWWKRQAADLQNKFSDAVRTSIANGETLQQAITRVVGGTVNGVQVQGVMQTTRGRAGALVATSMNHATNQARLATYQQNTDLIKAIQQVSTLDNRTSEICIAYAGLQWDAQTLEPIGHDLPFNGGPPRHFNCRSTLVPVTKSFAELGVKAKDVPVGTRASMDGEVPADISFADWLKGKGEAFQDGLLGQRKAELWRSGKITLQQLVNFNGDPISVAELEQIAEKGVKTASIPDASPKAELAAIVKNQFAPNHYDSVAVDKRFWTEKAWAANRVPQWLTDFTVGVEKKYRDIATSYNQTIKEERESRSNGYLAGSAVSSYVGSGYTQINNALRGLTRDVPERVTTYISEIRGLMEKSAPLEEDTVVYRGITGASAQQQKVLANLKPGDTYQTAGFVSTSIDPRVATGFSLETVFEIVLPKGSTRILRGFNINELEYLLDHGAKLRVVDTAMYESSNGKKIRVIRAVYRGV